jgi:hypothetical protein
MGVEDYNKEGKRDTYIISAYMVLIVLITEIAGIVFLFSEKRWWKK